MHVETPERQARAGVQGAAAVAGEQFLDVVAADVDAVGAVHEAAVVGEQVGGFTEIALVDVIAEGAAEAGDGVDVFDALGLHLEGVEAREEVGVAALYLWAAGAVILGVSARERQGGDGRQGQEGG